MKNKDWFFVIGGSSGFGLASAFLFAEKGYNIFIIHRDSRQYLQEIETCFQKIKNKRVLFESMNVNAHDKKNHPMILEKIKETLGQDGKIKVFLHSIADGNINPLIPSAEAGFNSKSLCEDDFSYTIHAMGTSFFLWSKLILENKLFAKNARIIGLTSEGSKKVLPGYAAVAASKSVLESACRYMAVELAPYGITTNLINAGITDTPALRVIPGYEELIEKAKHKNPFKRITLTEDIAKAIYLLSTDDAGWINGEIIRVDGGEQLMA